VSNHNAIKHTQFPMPLSVTGNLNSERSKSQLPIFRLIRSQLHASDRRCCSAAINSLSVSVRFHPWGLSSRWESVLEMLGFEGRVPTCRLGTI